jgi:hypothetical protein
MCERFRKCTYRVMSAGIVLGAALSMTTTFAKAGPCSVDIAQFEAAIRQSAGNPDAGLMAPQSVAAQNDRQPTVASVKKAERELRAKFAATMARARRLDARNHRSGCERALADAKRMYIL